jgi:hypothetical protein
MINRKCFWPPKFLPAKNFHLLNFHLLEDILVCETPLILFFYYGCQVIVICTKSGKLRDPWFLPSPLAVEIGMLRQGISPFFVIGENCPWLFLLFYVELQPIATLAMASHSLHA